MKVRKLVYGVGINDADYPTTKVKMINGKWREVWRCPYIRKWKGMLRRCYSNSYQEKQPTYKGCVVCEEWLTFSNFKRWMEGKNWEDRQLDKDFLVEGNKIYSPFTCIFIPHRLNSFITTSGKARGIYPLGVSYINKSESMVSERSKPYRSKIKNKTGNTFHLGSYSTPEEAHRVYLKAKLGYCEDHLTEFRDEIFIIKGLTRIYNKIKYHIDNNLELTSF